MESDITQSAFFFKLLTWFESNAKRVITALLLLMLLGVVIWYFVWRSGEKKIEAGQALAAAFVPQLSDPRNVSVERYLKVAAQYAEQPPGAQAALLAAATLFDQGKYTEAQQQFEKFTREHRGSPFMAQAYLGIAASLDALNKKTEAITAYKTLIDRYPSENVIPQAKFSLARLYLQENRIEDAFRLYEDLSRSDAFTQLGSEAGVRSEELKSKHPELAPPPPATPITVSPSLSNSIIVQPKQ